MTDLIAEAGRMPEGSIRFARGVSKVWTPDHLVPLRTRVRDQHRGELLAVHAALAERFGHTSADYLNVFRAAGEMAVMERVGRNELPAEDRNVLRKLWVDLLNAR